MSGLSGQAYEPFHFGLWVEMTVLMDYLSSDERAALLDALGISATEYATVSAGYREALQTNADPEKTAIFQAAKLDAVKGGRDHAIARFNGFLDALHGQVPHEPR